MTKFMLAPNQINYSASPLTSTIGDNTESGKSRYRRYRTSPNITITCVWTCDDNQYKYIMDFFRYTTQEGSLPFEIDLIIYDSDIIEHSAHFVPGTLTLSSIQGLTYTVSASLDVVAQEEDPEGGSIVSFYNEFGSDFEIPEDIFNLLINLHFPDAIL